jgi:hypothetical protein
MLITINGPLPNHGTSATIIEKLIIVYKEIVRYVRSDTISYIRNTKLV